ncbi:MAG: ATP-binding cassette domain-containing protein [Clostridia bacterium]|nr:ATP-binding cassette domain-containing protein [Clostridia bacterium]
MIRINKLLKRYKSRTIIQIDNFGFKDGLIYGIVGANGSGKSTLMKCLVNLVDYSGEIFYDDKEIKLHPEVLKEVGTIIETPMFYNDMSAIQNLDYFLPCKKDATLLLKKMGLYNVSDDKVKTYSMGMKQKLAIILACLKGDKIIILDEPFNGLDVKSVRVVINFLLSEKEKGKTIIVSSHMPNTINKLCDEIYTIEDKVLKRNFNENTTKKYVFTFNAELEMQKAKSYLEEKKQKSVQQLGFDLVAECNDSKELKEILKVFIDFDMVSYEELSQDMEAMC